MRKLAVVVTCLVFMSFAAAALAVGADDPDDTTGRLDVGYLGTYQDGAERVFEITTYERWRNRLFRSREERAQRGSVVFLFNTDADRAPEFSVTPERKDGRWVGKLCRIRTGRCEAARVWRESDHDLYFAVRLDGMFPAGTFGWRAKTKLLFRDGCADTDRPYCIDKAVGPRP